jgi:DNA segregation ATPase FtsK/SpoIIIE, S-DNA-T family
MHAWPLSLSGSICARFTALMDRLPPLPLPPSTPPTAALPIIAIIAPLLGAAVIFAILRSPIVLVFALVSPLIVIASALDARRTARRHRRAESARFDRECDAWFDLIAPAHAAERAAHDQGHRRIVDSDGGEPIGETDLMTVRLGSAPGPSAVVPDSSLAVHEGTASARLSELLAAAQTNPALPVTIAPGAIRVIGAGCSADAVARLISVHPQCRLERAEGSTAPGPKTEPTTELILETPTRARLRGADGRERVLRPEGITQRQLRRIRARARTAEARLPLALAWSTLQERASAAGNDGDLAPVGVNDHGAVVLDVLGDSPHVLVGGTTGSGKSEFLRTLALAWAANSPPEERSILLVDFKGGSAFAALAELPHVVGIITDLDTSGAERALKSLRAEVRRREEILIACGVRDVRDAPVGACARLLILVDEYAVLVELFPELQALIADLAARGRSLGIHLVLCTQRPAGVVRDAVAANCGTRVAFRMLERADAAALISAEPLPAGAPPGRAMISAAGRVTAAHMATISDDDIRSIAERWAASALPTAPWLPPLPAVVTRAEILELPDDTAAARSGGILLGMVDDPDRQRRTQGSWCPERDGSLLVLGAQGSGVHAALATIAEEAMRTGLEVIVLPTALADALGVLAELREQVEDHAGRDGSPRAPHSPMLLMIADIDALVEEAGERALELFDDLDWLARRLRRTGGALVASCSSLIRARAGVAARFDSILQLRAASLDDHRVAGGSPASFDRDAPAGRGRWRDRAIQLLEPSTQLPRARAPRIEQWSASPDQPVAVVSSRPGRLAERLGRSDITCGLDPQALTAGGPIVSDAESWQAAWASLARVRREGVIVLADVSEADARAVLGPRARIPLRGADADEVIVIDPDGARRARWAALSPPDAGSRSAQSSSNVDRGQAMRRTHRSVRH